MNIIEFEIEMKCGNNLQLPQICEVNQISISYDKSLNLLLTLVSIVNAKSLNEIFRRKMFSMFSFGNYGLKTFYVGIHKNH